EACRPGPHRPRGGPRRVQSELEVSPRRDAIVLLEAHAATRGADLVPIRYGRMLGSVPLSRTSSACRRAWRSPPASEASTSAETPNDPLFPHVTEAAASVLEPFMERSAFASHAQADRRRQLRDLGGRARHTSARATPSTRPSRPSARRLPPSTSTTHASLRRAVSPRSKGF